MELSDCNSNVAFVLIYQHIINVREHSNLMGNGESFTQIFEYMSYTCYAISHSPLARLFKAIKTVPLHSQPVCILSDMRT